MFHYHASLADALRSAFPDTEWDATRFKRSRRVKTHRLRSPLDLREGLDGDVHATTTTTINIPPQGYWNDRSNWMKELEVAEKKLGIMKVMLRW